MALYKHVKQRVARHSTYTSPTPPAHPTYNVENTYPQLFLTVNIVLGGGGGKCNVVLKYGNAFRRSAQIFDNYGFCITVPRYFVQDCRCRNHYTLWAQFLWLLCREVKSFGQLCRQLVSAFCTNRKANMLSTVEGLCRWCGMKFPLDTARNHVHQCPEIEIKCSDCKQLVRHADNNNREVCSHQEIICDCGEKVMQGILPERKQTTCPMKERTCPLQWVTPFLTWFYY